MKMNQFSVGIKVQNGKVSVQHAFEAHRTVRLSALLIGSPLLLERFLVLMSIRGLVDPRAIVSYKDYVS
jgi:hypothetical protein